MTALNDDLLPPPDEDELLPPPYEDNAENDRVSRPLLDLVAGIRVGELLPADFPLPALIRFAPDTRVRDAANADAAKLLALNPQTEVERDVAERALAHQREHVKTIEAMFEEATDTAFKLHRHLTSTRGDWLLQSGHAIKTVGERLVALTRRLQREEDERRRRAQEDADRQVREAAQRAAEEARRSQAPAAVVQELELEAETATAPPVSTGLTRGGGLSRSTVAEKWEARIAATDKAAAVRQPVMAKLTGAERACVLTAMKAVLEGRAPITIFEICWPVVNARAVSDKKAFAIEGFVAEDVGSLRAKPGTRK